MNLYLLTVEDFTHKFYVLAKNPSDAEKTLLDNLRVYYSNSSSYNVLNIQLIAKSSVNEDNLIINKLHNLFITDNIIITPIK